MEEVAINNTVTQKNTRNSNLELLRIFAMFLIIASHWGWAFGNEIVKQNVFRNYFRSFGQVGNIIFLLISAYFLCTKKFSLKSFIKLIIQNIFYNILISIAFTIYNQVCVCGGGY